MALVYVLASPAAALDGVQPTERSVVVQRWPGGAPLVVQKWSGQRHLTDIHLSADGVTTADVTYDEANQRAAWRRLRRDGSVEVSWTTERGRKHGEEVVWNEQGQRIRVIPWVRGKRAGQVADYDGEGHLISEVRYSDDRPVTPIVTYYSTGERRSTCSLIEDRRHGVETILHRDGWKLAEMPYRFGDLDGTARFFDAEGNLTASTVWARGRAVGPEVQWRPGGKRRAEIPVRGDGVRDGVGHGLDESGRVISDLPYREGKLHGFEVRYDSQGRRSVEVEWRQDEACCKVRTFWPSGALQNERTYVDLGLDGTETRYHDRQADGTGEGVVELRVQLIGGKKNGQVTSYDRSGNKLGSIWFVDDMRDGLEVRFYPTGERAAEFHWREDRPVGMGRTFWKNGRVQSEFPFDQQRGSGLERRWDEAGKLRMEVPLVEGKKHGEAKVWDGRGALIATVNYVDDVQDGPEVRFANGRVVATLAWRAGELVEVSRGDKTGPKVAADQAQDADGHEEGGDAAADAREAGQAPGVAGLAAGQTQTVDVETRKPDPRPRWTRTYWPSGKLRSSYPTLGKGPEVQFHENGEISLAATVVGGAREGEGRFYDRSGILSSRVRFVHGLMEGEEVLVGRSGERIGVRLWHLGKPVGIVRTWYPDGTLQSEYTHDESLPAGVEIQYHRNGAMRVYVPLRFGKRHGTATVYSEAGGKWAEVPWRDGRRQGEELRFGRDGTVTQRLRWEGGVSQTPAEAGDRGAK